MMNLLILSLAFVSAMGAPVILTPNGVALQPTSGGQLLTASQLNQLIRQQQAFLTQATDTQVNTAGQLSPSSGSVQRDPSNPTTDVVIHSGFPFGQPSLAGSGSISSGGGNLLPGLQTTRVGISSVGNAAGHTAHVATIQAATQAPPTLAPIISQPVIQPQQISQLSSLHLQQNSAINPLVNAPSGSGSLNLPPGTTFLIPASAVNGQTHQQLTAAGFRTIPISLSGTIPSTA